MPEDAKIIEMLIIVISGLGALGYRSLNSRLKEAHESRGKLYDRMDKLRSDMDDKFDKINADLRAVQSDLSELLGIMKGKGYVNGNNNKK